MTIVKKLVPDKVLRELKNVLYNLVDDTSINTVVKYMQHKAGTYNPTTQNVGTAIYTTFSKVNALKTYFTDMERLTVGGGEKRIEVGDVRFIVKKDDVTNSPSPEDKIVEVRNQSGVTYNIVTYRADPVGMAYIFHCRRP